jgi:hypothetical protein
VFLLVDLPDCDSYNFPAKLINCNDSLGLLAQSLLALFFLSLTAMDYILFCARARHQTHFVRLEGDYQQADQVSQCCVDEGDYLHWLMTTTTMLMGQVMMREEKIDWVLEAVRSFEEQRSVYDKYS